FKHTVERRREPTRIVVSAALEAGRLQVTLSDDSGTLADGGVPGIGMKNLRARLEVLYGGRASLALTQLAPAGVCARMEVPCGS
ncbi:MAG: sensor histidine kinase, partial [Massilia sp.]|nr:sensor histidine kinase [Massilia sp.]